MIDCLNVLFGVDDVLIVAFTCCLLCGVICMYDSSLVGYCASGSEVGYRASNAVVCAAPFVCVYR